MKIKLKVVTKLKNIEKRINAVKNMYDSSYLTKKLSLDMNQEVAKRFRNESDPDGKGWVGLKAGTLVSRYSSGLRKRIRQNKVRKKKEKEALSTNVGRAKILQRTGRLKRSVHARNTKTEAIVGTNSKYATTHNFGFPKKNVPQRRFMGLNRGQRIKYKAMVIKWQRGELK